MKDIHPTINPALLQYNHELNELCQLIRDEKVLLWVGSGFSSYAGYPTGRELTSLLLSQVRNSSDKLSNPESILLNEAADYFVESNSRKDLISLLIKVFGKNPSRCDIHESLVLIDRIKYIVTTNYDLLFEKSYGDKIVVVSRDKDLPGSGENPEKTILLKIHGDISQPDSIVITSEDYKKFQSDRIIWSEIRALLSKFPVVFIGYSLNDPNVKTMLDDINTRLQEKRHPFFFISNRVEESTRLDLASYDLHFIEMDAVDAIRYIAKNTIQFAYLDSMKNPALFSKSSRIFEKKGLRADRTFNGEKISHVSLTPIRPVKQRDIKVTITSKKGVLSPQMLAFQKFVTGESFDPVALTESDCEISIRGGEMNGILIFDPSIKSYPALFVTPKPDIDLIDLQLRDTSIRISNLNMRIFKSESFVEFEIDDPVFNLKLSFPKGQMGWTLNFPLRRAVKNIEQGRFIYGFFDRWMHGETMELIDERFPVPILIPSPPSSEIPPNFPNIHKLNQLYTDLSEIQRNLKDRISIPDEITSEDQRSIRKLASFLRGEKQKIPRFQTSVQIIGEIPYRLVDGETIPFEGPDLIGKFVFNFFGKRFEVPYRIEGSDFQFEEIEAVQKLIDQGVMEFNAIIKSKTEQLFALYNPQG
ncbi:MAG: SIR2 family NAD-dependent protein deacylase [Methanoregula sp.]